MKKILLGTTALIGAATLIAGAAFAEDPKVTVGGFETFEAGVVSDDFGKTDGTDGSATRDRGFRNDTEIHFNVAGKTDAGLGYGAEIDLLDDVTANANDSGVNAHRTYVYLQGDQWGRFEAGSNEGAAATMKVDAATIARASGGIDGDFVFFANVNQNGAPGTGGPTGTFASGENFITAAKLPVEHGPTDTWNHDNYSNDNKVNYYTPRFSGFQLGVSYAPSLSDRGETVDRVDSTPGQAGDIFEGGINYQGQFDQVGFAAAATGEHGKSDVSDYDDLNAWNGGAKVSFMGFSLAGSYGDWGKSLAPKTIDAKADYWTVGAAYETGPFGASVTYLDSKVSETGGVDNKFYDVSFGVDYKLAPGLTPFAEYTYYDLNPNGTVDDNKGGVFMIGTQLAF